MESMAKMKEISMNLIAYRNHLLMMTKIYHFSLKKEEEESKRLNVIL